MPTPRLRDLASGWSVLEIRGVEHVPGYDPEAAGRGLSDALYRAEVEGDWTASGGKLVIEGYDPRLHVSERPLPFERHCPIVCGWDLPAGTGGRHAVVPMQLQDDGCLYVFPGLLEPDDQSIGTWEFGRRTVDLLTREFALPARSRYQDLGLVHVGDPAGKQRPPRTAGQATAGMEVRSAKEILWGGERVLLGWEEDQPLYEARPGHGIRVMDGIVSRTKREGLLRARLQMRLPSGRPAFLLDPGATDLIDGLGGGYHYPQRSDGMYDYAPAKNRYSHCIEANAMVETHRGFIPICRVAAGDRVMTRDGWRRVSSSWCAGVRKCVEVVFSDGRVLVCTPDHRIWADGTWVEAGLMRYNTVCSARPFNTMDARSIATRMRRIGVAESTSTGTTGGSSGAFMRFCGKRIMDRFRMAAKSIIGTAIRSTTRLITSSALRLMSIERQTQNSEPTGHPPCWRIWIASGLSPKPGTHLWKAGRGTVSTERRWEPTCRSARGLASGAARLLLLGCPTSGFGTAAASAIQRPDALQALITRSAPALTAEPPSRSTDTSPRGFAPNRVVTVRALESPRLVWDLSVEDAPEFCANGILVHNCIDALCYGHGGLSAAPPGSDEDRPARRSMTRGVGRRAGWE